MKFRNIFSLVFILLLFNQCCEPCDDISCENNGICVDGTCDCPDGFTGTNCEINLNQKLKRLTRTGGFFIEYEYDLNNKLSKQTLFDNVSNTLVISDFIKKNDTIIETVNNLLADLIITKKYFKESESMVIEETYNNNASNLAGFKHYIFSAECGITDEIGFNAFGVEQNSVNWTYAENNCNYTTEYINQYGSLSNRVEGVILTDISNPIPSVFDHFDQKRIALLERSDWIYR